MIVLTDFRRALMGCPTSLTWMLRTLALGWSVLHSLLPRASWLGQ